MPDPERLGKYHITRTLGRGAMGVVYEGYDPDIERAVAIKTIGMDAIDRDLAQQYIARFRNEAKAAGRLHHPNIVGIYEYGEQPPVAYIAMEFVDGEGLREYAARRSGFDFAQLTALMSQLLDALEFAHSRGVVHRDIKPTNLIVTREGALKVADFGIARIDTSNLTTAGMVIGTPSYMSPEQCLGQEAEPRSDIFSSGVVLYELLTGHKPFTGSVPTIAYKICHEQPVPPSRISHLRLPKAVDDVVARAIAKEPQGRYPSARAFKEALQALAQLPVEVEDGQADTVVSLGDMPLQTSTTAWDDATLSTAEHELARFIGPLAKLMVRKAAARTRDPQELCALLSENIADATTREEFVKAFAQAESSAHRSGVNAAGTRQSSGRGSRHLATAAQATTASTSASLAGAASAPVDPVYLDRVTARLAVYVGPIAKLIARQAAQRARSRDEFVRLVADSVGTQDRPAFLKDAAKE